jgi:hypothetical protein
MPCNSRCDDDHDHDDDEEEMRRRRRRITESLTGGRDRDINVKMDRAMVEALAAEVRKAAVAALKVKGIDPSMLISEVRPCLQRGDSRTSEGKRYGEIELRPCLTQGGRLAA